MILALYPQTFGMARMYESAAQGERAIDLAVVDSRAEAEAGLAGYAGPESRSR